ncbi:MAG: YbaB/EbfC family nucleoid-associated protein [Candidatus Gracilibacteria bacterium]|jgi:DNA-binding YbaB/EbfC family protein
MGLFGQAKDMYRLQKQAKQIKAELKNLHIEAEIDGVKVIVDGEQEVQEVEVAPELLTPENKTKLEKALKAAFSKAIKKSQEIAAERMRGMMGDMGINLPGMPGGETPAS